MSLTYKIYLTHPKIRPRGDVLIPPVPIPVFLLWPLAPLVIAHGRIARDPRGIALLRPGRGGPGVNIEGEDGERVRLFCE